MFKFLPIGLTICLLSANVTNCSNQELTKKAENSSSSIAQINQNPPMAKTSPTVIQPNFGWQKNLKIDDIPYDIYIPKTYQKKALLVLPGWNYPRNSWIENSQLVEYADKYGYALILPEMLKTLYESSYYPETEMKWYKIPGGEFIKTRFIPGIQKKHNLLLPGENNTLLGLSTGGRGVALIALENPGLFVAGASLSGDFSQENTPDDRLMTAVYGDFKNFPARWQGRDNPMARAAEWKMPLYLAHGIADDIVPEAQSRLFYQALIGYHGNKIIIEYHPIKNAGHDYKFWGGQLPEVFKFLEKAIASR